ncbi:hypothetical protein FQA39_LY01067 [Lamprigera yunnana]|nr:hypothetical protein FQA39_LY01067 [Lamprigera yunnana]
MNYPNSPFSSSIDQIILKNHSTSYNYNDDEKIQNRTHLEKLLKWLCTYPRLTSFRVNTTLFDVNKIATLIEDEVKKMTLTSNIPKVEIHPTLLDFIILHNQDTKYLNLSKNSNEVIIDVHCAAAVLRGAHIFAPGVIGMLSGTKHDDCVSLYADLAGRCKKGFNKIYHCPHKLFLGNGLIKMTRYELFRSDYKPIGIAVEVTDRISGCLNLNENLFPTGSVLLQNIPSACCIHAMKIEPGLKILDMCAAPGNKTTHIATLMKNKGTLIAIDRTPSKVEALKETCDKFKATVHIFQANSTKILDKQSNEDAWNPLKEALFPKNYFDRILLDAPCSGLGKRPQFSNTISETILKSYIPLQRKLFETAVHLLKPNGYLLYSTCTITLGENEGMVAWALKNFNCLQLVKATPNLGGPGLNGTTLTDLQRSYVQRFGPDKVDSIGFFFALFIKTNSYNP